MITIEADWLSAFFRLAVIGLELAGTLTILVGAGLATFLFARRARAGDRTEAYSTFRSALGRSILLGLGRLTARGGNREKMSICKGANPSTLRLWICAF